MSGETFSQMEKDLELQELDSPGGIASAQVYAQLMAIYICKNDVVNAKFLWKRIPASIKSANAELGHIWNVGQKLWLHDYPGIYESLNKDWSDNVKPIMMATLEATRRRVLRLIGQAYSSIGIDSLCKVLCMSVEETVQAAKSQGWDSDPQTRMVMPKKAENLSEPIISNEQQLSQLTDFVSFLEK